MNPTSLPLPLPQLNAKQIASASNPGDQAVGDSMRFQVLEAVLSYACFLNNVEHKQPSREWLSAGFNPAASELCSGLILNGIGDKCISVDTLVARIRTADCSRCQSGNWVYLFESNCIVGVSDFTNELHVVSGDFASVRLVQRWNASQLGALGASASAVQRECEVFALELTGTQLIQKTLPAIIREAFLQLRVDAIAPFTIRTNFKNIGNWPKLFKVQQDNQNLLSLQISGVCFDDIVSRPDYYTEFVSKLCEADRDLAITHLKRLITDIRKRANAKLLQKVYVGSFYSRERQETDGDGYFDMYFDIAEFVDQYAQCLQRVLAAKQQCVVYGDMLQFDRIADAFISQCAVFDVHCWK